MTRDELADRMIDAYSESGMLRALDVALAEVLKYKCATEEEGKAVRLHNIGVSMDCILAELFENRRAHYSAPREKTLAEKAQDFLRCAQELAALIDSKGGAQ